MTLQFVTDPLFYLPILQMQEGQKSNFKTMSYFFLQMIFKYWRRCSIIHSLVIPEELTKCLGTVLSNVLSNVL